MFTILEGYEGILLQQRWHPQNIANTVLGIRLNLNFVNKAWIILYLCSLKNISRLILSIIAERVH